MLPDYPYELKKEDSGLHAPEFCSVEVEYMDLLYSLCASIKAEHILEIGVARGGSTWWFYQWLKQHPICELYCVDTTLKKALLPVGLVASARVHLHAETSDSFFQTYLGLFDFVLIDGGHTYSQCKRDFKNALKTKPSIIALHDTVFHDKDVGKVVKEEHGTGLWTHFPFGKGLSYVRLSY